MDTDAELQIVRLQDFFHYRWTVPALAGLHAMGGQTRFVMLLRSTGAPRGSLQRTLIELVKAGLVRRNPGYGHPLRPEYLLSAKGRRVAPASAALLDAIERVGQQEIALRKWSVPVTAAVADGNGRFGEAQAALPGITPRALTQALRDLTRANWIARKVDDGFPPRPSYEATAEGRRFVRLARELVPR